MTRRMRERRAARSSPYARVARGGSGTPDDQWRRDAALRRVFDADLTPAEAPRAVCTFAATRGDSGTTVTGYAAATDGVLYLRLVLGPGIHQRLAIGYDRVRDVHASPDGHEVTISYFDPVLATTGSWYQSLVLREVSVPGLSQTLLGLVQSYQEGAAAVPLAVPGPAGIPPQRPDETAADVAPSDEPVPPASARHQAAS